VRGLLDGAKDLLFEANPSRQIATNYRSRFQRSWVSKGEMAVQCLEHSRIRTLNVTLSRKPSAIAFAAVLEANA
jgi:hypothetical protein